MAGQIFNCLSKLNNTRQNYCSEYDYENSINYFLFKKIESYFNIESVKKVYNLHLYELYLLCKEELRTSSCYGKSKKVKEKWLFHATSAKNAMHIAQNNIDWRKTSRSRYGIGACFSPCPYYANKHAGSTGAFVIFKVLLKIVEKVNVNYHLEVPESIECDTTSGNDGSVYVKYDDYNFYPEYIVYYNDDDDYYFYD